MRQFYWFLGLALAALGAFLAPAIAALLKHQ